MPDPWDSSPVVVPSYSMQLPWIGPILGETRGPKHRRVRLGAGSDPLLGNAAAVLLVPVHADSQEARFKQRHCAWLGRARCDRSGLFSFDAPACLWDAVDGVLMALLYDQSADPWAPLYVDTLAAQFAQHRREPWDGSDAEPIQVERLPEAMRTEVERQLRLLLARPMRELEGGLIAIDGRETCSPGNPLALTFAVASCQYPAGFLDLKVAERSYRRLARCLDRKAHVFRPECALLLGDQIYADATAGLFDPVALYDRFELPYERLLRMAPLRAIQRRIPTYAMLDDHEIEDNWEPAAERSKRASLLDDARSSYLRYQRIAGPDAWAPGCLWYPFEVRGFPFFMADTRTERDPRTAATIETAQIMSGRQFEELRNWLIDPARKDRPKFVASPASFLPRHLRATQNKHPASAVLSDGWDGYPRSFDLLMLHIATEKIRNVVFLSGDEHISFATTAVIKTKDGAEVTRFHSIHSSALYAPFPFANSIEESLAYEEHFPIGNYRCHVSTEFAAPGDGFAWLRVRQDREGKWELACRFMRGPRPSAIEKTIVLTL